MENKKRLKIGIFMDSFYPAIDGVVLVVDNLAKELSKNNDVTLVVPYTASKKEDKERNYEVIRINSVKVPFTEYRLGKYKIKQSYAYKKLLKKDFDIIHIHSPFTIGNLGIRIARKLNIPCIATMHTRFDFEIRKVIDNDHIVNGVIKEIIKQYNKCDEAIAINHAMIKVFKDFGYTSIPTVIYNGTDLKPLNNKDKYISELDKKYNLDKDDIVFSFVGRITEIKNIFFILDALKLLKEDGINFKMFYVGTGPDENKLKTMIKNYNMEKEVITTGRITDRTILSSIYARSTLFLFPSLFDASSLVQIEAAVNETPGLFIEGSVTSDTVINNVNGFTSPNNIEDYKNRIKEILNDKKLLNSVSHNARIDLGKSWEEVSIDTNNFYYEVIDKYNKNKKS